MQYVHIINIIMKKGSLSLSLSFFSLLLHHFVKKKKQTEK